MAIRPCSMCGSRFSGRAVTAYVARYTAEGDRVCYRLQTDPECAVDMWAPLLSQLHDSAELDVCPFCGTTFDDAPCGVYVVCYLPGEQVKRWEFPTCAACLQHIVDAPLNHGDRQRNRDAGVRGPSPSAPTDDSAGRALSALAAL